MVENKNYELKLLSFVFDFLVASSIDETKSSKLPAVVLTPHPKAATSTTASNANGITTVAIAVHSFATLLPSGVTATRPSVVRPLELELISYSSPTVDGHTPQDLVPRQS